MYCIAKKSWQKVEKTKTHERESFLTKMLFLCSSSVSLIDYFKANSTIIHLTFYIFTFPM